MIERIKDKLKGKKVLFISAKFYHYGAAVHEKIKSYGGDVTFYYERDISFKHVVVANFFQNQLDKRQDDHYRKILEETAHHHFDYLIVIRGYKMQDWFIETLKKRNPDIYTIMYQWDSLSFWDSDYRYLMPSFHRTLTFDYKDSSVLNIPYCPTFHMDEYSTIKKCPQTIDFIFCSNYTDEKYSFIKKFLTYASQRGYKVHSHLYLSWFRYIKERLKGNKIHYNHISFKRLKRDKYFELFQKSKTIVDFSATVQTGLTMRLIDALGSGKRVLTNNSNVVQEPGFNARQIIIYNANDLSLPEYIAEEEEFEAKDYSIDKWLDNLFFAT